MEQYDIEEWDQTIPYKTHMIAGCTAGIVEHFIILPFDNIKTHSQYKLYENKSYLQIIKKIYSQNKSQNIFQKLGNFYKGGSMVSLGCGPAHASFFTLHEFNKAKIQNFDQNIQPLLFLIGGGFTTLAHDIFMTPFDAIKQRSQLLHDMSNSMIIKKMIKHEGLFSFYRSFSISLFMNIPWNGFMIMTNETIKPLINQDKDHGFASYFFCAGFSSFIATVLTMPLDNIKMRLQTQNCMSLDDQTIIKYKNIKQTFQLIKVEEGFKGFYKGVLPKIFSTVPSSAISWSTYEILKKLLLNLDNKF